jgi:eukaryotic-like serine/threonine-protein kinase
MMGVVYEAHDPVLGRDIALKVIQGVLGATEEERQGFERRFFAEARAAARLTHPGIVVVHDVGRDPDSGVLYMALELLRGRPLDAVLRERPRLEWREAFRITRRVAEALHHAHSQGVVHRDVKPANIMLLDIGEPKIMDFGIAKVEASQLTATGQFLGTPLYMSPEQALAHPIDARSDIFALGAVLYEMLTGRRAFAGESVTKILFHIVSREPDPATRLVAALPAGVDYVLARSLAKDRGARYPDAQTLADDLEDILAEKLPRGQGTGPRRAASGTVVATPAAAVPAVARPRAPDPAARPRPGREPGTSRKRVVVASVFGIAALGAGFFRLWNGDEPVARRATSAVPPSGPTRSSEDAAPASNEEPATKPPEPSAPNDPAHLLINFEHSLKAGVLRVWVDDQPVIEEAFGGRVTREIGGIKLRKGRLSDALEVSPGRREVRVQVSWEDSAKTQRIFTNFKPGSTYRLKARLGSLGGLRKDLSLEWN